MGTLGTVGNIASLAGLVISLLGLGFAILQLRKLRGETRAAKAAAQRAEQAVRRDLTVSELASLREKVRELKDAHRRGDKNRAYGYYRDIASSLSDIEIRHPNLSDDLGARLRSALASIADMERFSDNLEAGLPREQISEFNFILSEMEMGLIPELWRRLPRSNQGGMR